MGLVSRLCVAFLLVSFVTCQAVEEPQRKPKQVREKGQRMSKFRKLVKPLQEDISELQETVQSISNPVHVHVHGISNDGDKVVENWAVDQHGREVQDTNPAPPRAGDRRHHHRGRKINDNHRDERYNDNKYSNDEDEADDTSPRQSHVHIHLNMLTQASSLQGQGHRRHEGGGRGCHNHGFEKNEYIYAKCRMVSSQPLRGRSHNIQGNVYLRQKPGEKVEVKVQLSGFKASRNSYEIRRQTSNIVKRGFHVHEFGDMENGCKSFGGHFNPEGHAHGGPGSHHKHSGDWGNIENDQRGVVNTTFTQDAFLYGPKSIIGRGIVVHEGADDHGEGGTDESRKTGSAGNRIACCVITHYNGDKW